MFARKQMRGYLDAVDPAQHIDVMLGGRVQRIARARLGLHLRLARFDEEFGKAKGAMEMAHIVREYLVLCGADLEDVTGTEALIAYATLNALNRWQWELPFMREPQAPRQLPAYEYPNRVWAWWVHKLSSRYGWTRDEVFNLWPEEAACYLQEIFVAEFDETEERRSLSELAYHYDRGSKTSRYVPMPRPAWMVPSVPPRPHKVRKDMLPVGNVVKLDDLAKKLH